MRRLARRRVPVGRATGRSAARAFRRSACHDLQKDTRIIRERQDTAGLRPVKVLTPGGTSVGNVGEPGGFDWSPDGRSIVFAHQPTPYVDDWPRQDVSIVDVDSGAVR